ncbi:MAG: competence/damage-inducible protein A [Proteobacteria bacterium]|nr:competence/damage-inducible protein A [Pseudomonadota bacterium]MBI3499994.1 competence/damage-inducible protein A [Pseudomonadota bacterium]
MSADSVVTAAVIIIGNEVLSGRTQDTNLNWLARELTQVGVRLIEARVIRDEERAIVAAVNELRERVDYVFTTGGIGPTHDDITSECIAKAFGLKLIRNPEAVRRLEAHYPPGSLNEARLRMANTPEGATLIENPVSKAPGFQIGNVYVMAGVPSVMRAMFDGIKGRLRGGALQLSRTVSCTLGEGVIAKDLAALQGRYGDLEIGSYPYFRAGGFGVSLVIRGTEALRLLAAAEELKAIIRALGGDPREEEAA